MVGLPYLRRPMKMPFVQGTLVMQALEES